MKVPAARHAPPPWRSPWLVLLTGLGAFLLTAGLRVGWQFFRPSSPAAEPVQAATRATAVIRQTQPLPVPTATRERSTPSPQWTPTPPPTRPAPRRTATSSLSGEAAEATERAELLPGPTSTRAATPSPLPTATRTPLAGQGAMGLRYFGVEMAVVSDAHGLAQAVQAGVGTVRVSALRWDLVEPVRTDPPTYDWGALPRVEEGLANAARAGIQVSLVVHRTPPWAQAVPGSSCGPIRDDALPAFAEFLTAAVQRYGVAPYNVKHWELGNEPDVDPSLVAPDSVFGCWGDQNDEYYGGRTYARLLRVAYPAIKRADPGATVIFGGLLLDSPTGRPARFLEGVLEAGAADAFDVLAFHAYTYYWPGVYRLDLLPNMPWASRGGVVAGKATYLRELMARYDVQKPLILNETGYGWNQESDPPDGFRRAQADYVAMLLTQGLALDLTSVYWYGWQRPIWRHMSLLNLDLSPRPGATAYAFAVRQLGGARYLGPAAHAGIEGYVFGRGEVRLEVLWSLDGQERPVTYSQERFRAAHDSVGGEVPVQPAGGQVSVTVLQPVYVELAP